MRILIKVVPPKNASDIDDSRLPAEYCGFCTHYNNAERRCSAFPNGIPVAIYNAEADHRKPFEGDGGIQFEAKNPNYEEYVDMALADTARSSEKGSSELRKNIRGIVDSKRGVIRYWLRALFGRT